MPSELAHWLYEAAVQTPEWDVEVVEGIFRRRRRRTPLRLREDFAGTARLSVAWVDSDEERTATAVDLEPDVLAFARKHHVTALGPDRRRIRLVRRDVRKLSRETYDLIVAPNFSWASFTWDDELRTYLTNAARSLEEDGLLFLELFGGPDLRRPLTHEHRRVLPERAAALLSPPTGARRVRGRAGRRANERRSRAAEASHVGAFTYVWEQRRFDPKSSVLDARIHFVLPTGQRIRNAFVYRFKIRPLEGLRRLLREAGFERPALYVERLDGKFRVAHREPDAKSYNGYLVMGRR